MKLKNHAKLALRLNPMIFIAQVPTSEHDPETEKHLKRVHLGTKEMGHDPCYRSGCDNVNMDYCWNCDRPVCRIHSYRVVFAFTGIIFNVCRECAEAIENSEILHKIDDILDMEL